MIHPSYAHVVTVQRPARFPSRFAALDSLLSAVTSAGVGRVVAGPHPNPLPAGEGIRGGLEAISIFSDTSNDQFLIMRINRDTFTITRRSMAGPRGA